MATHVKDLTLTNASDDGRTYHVLPDWHRTRYDGGCWHNEHDEEGVLVLELRGAILVPFFGEPDAIWFDQFYGHPALDGVPILAFEDARIGVARYKPAWALNEMTGCVEPVQPPRSEPVLVLSGVSGDVVPDRLRDRVNRLVSEVNRLVNDGGADFDVADELKTGHFELARVADKLRGDDGGVNESKVRTTFDRSPPPAGDLWQ